MTDLCFACDCYDPDLGCTMPSIDRSYACPYQLGDDIVLEMLHLGFSVKEKFLEIKKNMERSRGEELSNEFVATVLLYKAVLDYLIK